MNQRRGNVDGIVITETSTQGRFINGIMVQFNNKEETTLGDFSCGIVMQYNLQNKKDKPTHGECLWYHDTKIISNMKKTSLR